MWLLTVFVLYLLGLAAIGIYCARMNRSLADFVLGGRRLGPWVTALSAQASDMSGWLLIGLPAMAYATGLSMVWTVAGCLLGTVFNWLVIAPRLRRATGAAGALTIPDYLSARYRDGRVGMVRIAAVVVILLAYATYIAGQFTAAGILFETTFRNIETPWGTLSMGYHTGMLVGVGIILLYTAMGGFMAVAWTDFAQGLLMVLTVVLLPLLGLIGLGGTALLWSELKAADPNLLGVSGIQGASGWMFAIGVVVGGSSWGLGYPGQPHILVRFMAIRDEKAMSRAAVIGICWVALAMVGAVFVGLVGRVMLVGLTDQQRVMPELAIQLMHPALAGVMIAGGVAAMMSTVDSQLLVAASAVEQDIYIRLLGGRPEGRAAVWIGRITVIVLGLAALPIAWGRKSVFAVVFDAWGLLGAALGPVVILAVLTKRTNRWGALVGIVVGLAVVQFWSLIGGKAYLENGLVPGFVLNLVLAYVVSLATGGARASVTRPARGAG